LHLLHRFSAPFFPCRYSAFLFGSLNEKGMNDTWTPSALTTVFFLLFCAVVLYVVSRPQPPLPPPDAAH
jgi:hypothetical protein